MSVKKQEIEEQYDEDYSYLLDEQELAQEGVEAMGQTFHRVTLGGTEIKVDESSGTEINPSKYNSPAFPGYNYDNLYVIPLLIQSDRRAIYAGAYEPGTSKPPTCWSPDGIRPAVPGTPVLGHTVEDCATCPFAVYGSDPACMPRPGVYGLAMFHVGGQLKFIPVFLDVATMSRDAIKNLDYAFNKPVQLNGTTKILPRFTRVIKLGRVLKNTKRGTITAWSAVLLGPDSNALDPHEGLKLPNFTPKHIVDNIGDLMDAAHTAVQAMKTPVLALTSQGPVAALPGATTSHATQHTGSIDAQSKTISMDDEDPVY